MVVYWPHGTTAIVIIIVKRATVAASNWADKTQSSEQQSKGQGERTRVQYVLGREEAHQAEGSTRERGVGGAQPTSRPWPPCGGRDGGFSFGRASLRYALRYATPDQEPRPPS